MTVINLDLQPEAVRQFVLALSGASAGTVLESGGRPIACVVPTPTPGNAKEEDWTPEKDDRRCALIDRKYAESLSPEEEAELALLQAGLYRHADRVAPLPLDAIRKLHRELLARATQAQSDGNSGPETQN